MGKNTERKELEYYLNLRYPVTVHPDPEGGFVGEIEELPGCMTQSETMDEIFQLIEDARQLWIKTAYDEGQDIPLPRDMEKYTGKFLVRIPRGLHRDLARFAKREGVSLNQYVISLLSAGVTQYSMGIQITDAMPYIFRYQPGMAWGSTEKRVNYEEFLSMTPTEVKR